MTPIVAKEIRLLLPAYAMALLLAIVPIWLLPGESATIFSFCFGTVILALSSLGREFALRTLPLQLAQPLERSRIWWTKIRVLAIAMFTVMAAWLLSITFARFAFGHSFGFELGRSLTEGVLLIGAGATMVSFSGGLWSTLLLRQIIAAFWFTILIPLAILVITSSEKTSALMWPALALYSIAGFLWAWRQFLRAQETGWTGGDISFPGWRSAQAVSRASMRTYRPVAALFGRNFNFIRLVWRASPACFYCIWAWSFCAGLALTLSATSSAPDWRSSVGFGSLCRYLSAARAWLRSESSTPTKRS